MPAPVMADALRNDMGPTGTRCDDIDLVWRQSSRAGNSSVARALVAGAGGLPSTHCRSPAVQSGGTRPS